MPELTQVQFRESSMQGADGASLRIRQSLCGESPRAEVILTHGMGEHSRRYEHVAEALASRGIRVSAYDLRGHGRSSGRRGDARSYDLFIEDLRAVHDGVSGESGKRPVFLLGHSFGGQITVRYLQRFQPDIRGAVVTSPWLRLAFEPAWWRIALAHASRYVCPGWAHRTPTTPEKLSRDLAYLAGMPDSDLTHRRLSPRLFFAIVRAGSTAIADARRLLAPLLLIHGEADTVTCAKASQQLLEQAGSSDKTLKLIPDALHETHNDLCREAVIETIGDWIDARI